MNHAPLPTRVAPSKPEKLVLAYGDELLQMARTRKEIVVLDGDLLSDCGIEAFKAELPERFHDFDVSGGARSSQVRTGQNIGHRGYGRCSKLSRQLSWRSHVE